MTIRAFGPVSSTTGAAIERDLSTISIGFSKTVSNALMGLTTEDWLSAVRGRSLRVSVISARGVVCNSEGSGDCDGFGVGIGGGNSGVLELRVPRTGALFLFRGEAFLVGESGAGVIIVASASNISEGSTFSLPPPLLGRPEVLGVLAMTFVVFRLVAGAFRGDFLGAGVKSSSLSSSLILDCASSSSSSSDSTTNFLRDAALREGLAGVSDIFEM